MEINFTLNGDGRLFSQITEASFSHLLSVAVGFSKKVLSTRLENIQLMRHIVEV